MITILSPSKTQEYADHLANESSISYTVPSLLHMSEVLVTALKRKSADDLHQLMNISDRLANLTYERYQQFSLPFSSDNARQALLAFRGDVYTDIDIDKYELTDFDFAQDHVRILSGLYGLLRPLDLIQPYRLEMKTPLITSQSDNLYQFWRDRITILLNETLQKQDHSTLVNLASQEYSKVINTQELNGRVVTPLFKEDKNGKFSTVAIYAKRARGKMTNFIIRNRIEIPEELKTFNEDRYEYCEFLSTHDEWVFIR